MSLSASLSTAVSGLQTTQRQIQVTSGNVSNANVEGYSRKTASPITSMTQGRNSGVELSQITREVNAYLNGQLRKSDTAVGELSVKAEFHQRVTDMFGTLSGDNTLANGLNDLAKAFEALGIEPESATVRRDVVEAADQMAKQLNRFASETKDLRVEADRRINQAVSDANTALANIKELNDDIASGLATEEPVGELRDERDRALSTLSELMDVETFERSTGQLVVTGKMSDGSYRTLVDSNAVQFDFEPANAIGGSGDGNFPALTTAASPPNGNEELDKTIGGKLGQLIETRDETLPGFHADIDRLTQQIRDQVNAAHNLGTFGNAAQATITGGRAIPGGSQAITTADVSGQMTLVFNTGGTMSEQTIDFDAPAPGFNGTDVSDLVSYMNNQISGGDPISINGDDQMVIDATAIGADTVAVDTGSAQVAGDMDRISGQPTNLSHYFGLNDLLVTPEDPSNPTAIADLSGTLSVRSDIVADPELLSRGTADRNGGPTAVAAGDNTAAQTLAGVFDKVREIPATAGGNGGNLDKVDSTLSGYAADILAFQASATAEAERDQEFQETLRDELQLRADSVSGVNIDQELSHMITLEQAYNASARVIATVQQMFDTLDRMVN